MRNKFIYIILVLFLYAICSSADLCGTNCPSGNCESCFCGDTPSFINITKWCEKYNQWDQKCCECILKSESNGNVNALFVIPATNKTNSTSKLGLWQIDQTDWNLCSDGPPCDPTINLLCATEVWKQSRSFNSWSSASSCGCSSGNNSGNNGVISSDNSTQKKNKQNVTEQKSNTTKENQSLSSCGGNCRSGLCKECICGTNSNIVNVTDLCNKYGKWNKNCCECLGNYLSKGNTNALNQGIDNLYSVGIWQISENNWNNCNNGKAPCDSEDNLKCAISLWEIGKDFRLWSKDSRYVCKC